MDSIHSLTCWSEEMDFERAFCSYSSTISIQDLIGMAEDKSLSLEGVDGGSLEGFWESVSLAMPFPLSRRFAGIICFEEIHELENQEQNLYRL